MNVRFLSFIVLGVVAAATSPLPVFADSADVDRSPVLTDSPGVSGVDAKLVRTDNTLGVQGTFHGVAPRETFTVWWILPGADGVLVLNATGRYFQ
jgi:hypothetical protein